MMDVTPLARMLALTGLLMGASALAQPEGLPKVELERLVLNPSATGSLLLGTGDVLPGGGYRFSLTGHYENDPLVLFDDGVRLGAVVQHRVTGHLAGAYGLTNRLEVSAQVPVLLVQRGDDLTARGVGKPAQGLGLGTPYLGLRWAVLSERDQEAVDLSVGAHVGLPVGSSLGLARDGTLRAIPSIMVGRRFGWLRAGVDAGMLLRPRTLLGDDAVVEDEVGHEVRLGAGVATTGEGLRGELDVMASLALKRESHPIEVLAGVRMPLSEALEGYALVGLGVGDAPGTPTFRGLLGVAFGQLPPKCVAGGGHAPEQCPELDDDNDGVKNRDDTCPRQGGRVDAQGCPVKDSDGDGVLDPEDRCPKVAGEAALQGCPDADKDGIEDAADKCPQVFGVAAFQGCPDTDKDGLEDATDQCPAEAGPAERQGCPVKDSDKDGLLDEQDACPSQAGLPELKGCPAKDQDQDAVADHLDNCPADAGPAENQGCPAKQRQLVAIQQGRIEIKDTVYFDTGKATIQRRSFPLLDQVAKVLLVHPELEKVRIEGHTDNRGKAEMNRTLSQRRAEAVRNYLIKKGVASQRLDAKGFGPDRPIAPNTTEKGRAANRRVEFITTPSEGTQP